VISEYYTNLLSERIVQVQSRQERQDLQEYFEAEVVGFDGNYWIVKALGGTLLAENISNTSPRIAEVVTLYWPAGSQLGRISRKVRS
jgi:hypothetical protein